MTVTGQNPIHSEGLTLSPRFAVELNADLGEGAGNDAQLLSMVKMANISCGAHAGNEKDIRETLLLARKHDVRVGAHPGYPDTLSTKGRVPLEVHASRIENWCDSQVSQLSHWATIAQIPLEWIKPHGAMYNQACTNAEYANAIANVARRHCLALMGLPGTELERAALEAGVHFIKEGFADRAYQEDGLLVPRDKPNAFIHDPQVAFEQMKLLCAKYKVTTICVHGDNPDALKFTSALVELMNA